MRHMLKLSCRRRNNLEPISKSPEEDYEAGDLHEAKEVLRIKPPAHEKTALALNSGEEQFDPLLLAYRSCRSPEDRQVADPATSRLVCAILNSASAFFGISFFDFSDRASARAYYHFRKWPSILGPSPARRREAFPDFASASRRPWVAAFAGLLADDVLDLGCRDRYTG